MCHGTWQNQTGQTGCMNASVGHYVDVNGSSSQTPCATGTWNNMTGQAVALTQRGALRGHERIISQTPCATGTWQNQTGQTGCMNASAGLRGHERVDDQTPWARHLEQHDRAGHCTNASAGTTWTRTGRRRRPLRCGDVQPNIIIQLLR